MTIWRYSKRARANRSVLDTYVRVESSACVCDDFALDVNGANRCGENENQRYDGLLIARYVERLPNILNHWRL
jgi:hypothetical protein